MLFLYRDDFLSFSFRSSFLGFIVYFMPCLSHKIFFSSFYQDTKNLEENLKQQKEKQEKVIIIFSF